MCIASAASPNTNILAPAPATPVAQAPPVVENILNVNAPVVINGMQRVEHVRLIPPTALSARCIIAMGHVQMTIFPVRNCLVLLFMKNQPARMVG